MVVKLRHEWMYIIYINSMDHITKLYLTPNFPIDEPFVEVYYQYILYKCLKSMKVPLLAWFTLPLHFPKFMNELEVDFLLKILNKEMLE